LREKEKDENSEDKMDEDERGKLSENSGIEKKIKKK